MIIIMIIMIINLVCFRINILIILLRATQYVDTLVLYYFVQNTSLTMAPRCRNM
jgi:hypothetical protein